MRSKRTGGPSEADVEKAKQKEVDDLPFSKPQKGGTQVHLFPPSLEFVSLASTVKPSMGLPLTYQEPKSGLCLNVEGKWGKLADLNLCQA